MVHMRSPLAQTQTFGKKYRCVSPDAKINQSKKYVGGKIVPLNTRSDMSDQDKEQYNTIIASYDQCLALVTVKEIQRFAKLTGKGAELSLAYQTLYFIAEIDGSILLSND
jgi:hypothetical protein